jgi:hypothetical protein
MYSKNDKVIVTQPNGFFSGNSAATAKGETAQLFYAFYEVKDFE